jgi:hypothetical protein
MGERGAGAGVRGKWHQLTSFLYTSFDHDRKERRISQAVSVLPLYPAIALVGNGKDL